MEQKGCMQLGDLARPDLEPSPTVVYTAWMVGKLTAKRCKN